MMLSSAERRIVDDVERFGWHIVSVSPRTDSDDPDEWFSYTVGLQRTFGWPEIICFGLATTLMANLLNDAVAELRTRAIEPQDGIELVDVLKGFSMKLVRNEQIPFNYLGFANWYAAYTDMSDPPQRLQIVWPDRQGYFPDDPRCEPEVRWSQTPIEVSD